MQIFNYISQSYITFPTEGYDNRCLISDKITGRILFRSENLLDTQIIEEFRSVMSNHHLSKIDILAKLKNINNGI